MSSPIYSPINSPAKRTLNFGHLNPSNGKPLQSGIDLLSEKNLNFPAPSSPKKINPEKLSSIFNRLSNPPPTRKKRGHPQGYSLPVKRRKTSPPKVITSPPTEEWLTKKCRIETRWEQKGDEEPVEAKYFIHDGKDFRVALIGQGAEHYVYRLEEEKCISFTTAKGTVEVDARDVILKKLHPLKESGDNGKRSGVSDFVRIHRQSIGAYERLQREGINLPKAYVRPDQHTGQDGGYWIIERLPTGTKPTEWKEKKWNELSSTTKKILDFVKDILTKEVKEVRIIVGDFYPRNVMINREGQPCVIDFAPIKKNWVKEVGSNLLAWSNQSRYIFEHLISGFPITTQQTMRTSLLEEGKVPKSNQTHL